MEPISEADVAREFGTDAVHHGGDDHSIHP
jgi:hypothetical protein